MSVKKIFYSIDKPLRNVLIFQGCYCLVFTILLILTQGMILFGASLLTFGNIVISIIIYIKSRISQKNTDYKPHGFKIIPTLVILILFSIGLFTFNGVDIFRQLAIGIGVLTNSPQIIKKFEVYGFENFRLREMGIKTKDISICNYINEVGELASCYTGIAKYKNDITICEDLSDKIIERGYTFRGEDVSITRLENCYIAVAIANKNISVCQLIDPSSEIKYKRCYDNFNR